MTYSIFKCIRLNMKYEFSDGDETRILEVLVLEQLHLSRSLFLTTSHPVILMQCLSLPALRASVQVTTAADPHQNSTLLTF